MGDKTPMRAIGCEPSHPLACRSSGATARVGHVLPKSCDASRGGRRRRRQAADGGDLTTNANQNLRSRSSAAPRLLRAQFRLAT